MQLQDFFADAEARAIQLPEHERDGMLERLERAREVLGNINALERIRLWRSPQELVFEAALKHKRMIGHDPRPAPTAE